MSWSFETDGEFQEQLDWAAGFVRDEIEPIDMIVANPYDLEDPVRAQLIPPLQQRVRARGLWACHLGADLGGPGFGQLKLALLNEILGVSKCAPLVFGCQAPDSGNSEILARYGSEELQRRYLGPLVDNEIVSAIAMTEPQGGSDPTAFATTATLDADEWILNGEKWFATNARFASILLVLAITEPDEPLHGRMSMIVVPRATPGVSIVRNVGIAGHDEEAAVHGYLRFDGARVPAGNLVGERGQGFVVAQTRLGGGRIHHAMRAVGMMRRAFDDMCSRAVSRQIKGEPIARKQLVQAMIADSWTQLEQFRLLVLQTAWKIDKYRDYSKVRGDISAVKALMPTVLRDIAGRAIQIHGSLGVSNEMPFGDMVLESYHLGLADGPTEVHKTVVARQVLNGYEASDDLFPPRHLPRLRAEALARFADLLAEQ